MLFHLLYYNIFSPEKAKENSTTLAVMEPKFYYKTASHSPTCFSPRQQLPISHFFPSFQKRRGAQRKESPPPLIIMAEKRKYHCPLVPTVIDDNLTYSLETNEMRKLTKVDKFSDFTCHYCSKSFNSAQAMGGHQNAHRDERLEEKRFFLKDPTGYRKRAFLRAMNAAAGESSQARGGNNPPGLDLNEASELINHELASINDAPPKAYSNGAAHGNNNLCQSSDEINGRNLKIFLPVEELNLAEKVGVHAENGKGKGIIEFGVGGYGENSENLDLTLKL